MKVVYETGFCAGCKQAFDAEHPPKFTLWGNAEPDTVVERYWHERCWYERAQLVTRPAIP